MLIYIFSNFLPEKNSPIFKSFLQNFKCQLEKIRPFYRNSLLLRNANITSSIIFRSSVSSRIEHFGLNEKKNFVASSFEKSVYMYTYIFIMLSMFRIIHPRAALQFIQVRSNRRGLGCSSLIPLSSLAVFSLYLLVQFCTEQFSDDWR